MRKNIRIIEKIFIASVLIACSPKDQISIISEPTDIGQGFSANMLQAPWHGKNDKTRFCCHSSSEHFFFSFEVEDSTLIDPKPSDNERVVDDEDRIEIFFSPIKSLKKRYFCAEIDAAGRIMDYRSRYYRKFDYDWDFKSMKAEAMITPWGYRVAGSVSRKELLSLGIDLDNGFWMGVYRGDRIDDGSLEWYSLVPADVEVADFHVPGVMFECKASPKAEKRGVVVYPDDITSLGIEEWEKRIDISGINLIALHAATVNDPIDTLEAFIRDSTGRNFLAMCARKGIDVEYELHALEYLLPRDLFATHPDYFRMDAEGRRCQTFNMCFSSKEAVEAMRPQLEHLLEWVKPTTHRYYFWADDKQGMFCNCENCSSYSPSEQILVFENHLLSMLREYDPKATLSHLAYLNTIEAPRRIRPANGIFLEYAPIKRDYSVGLTNEQTTALRDNLMAFPGHTAHILEYWLDESMFSRWKKDHPVQLPFKIEQTARDINAYREFGATDITCFATWLNANYVKQFGPTDKIFEEYGESFGK